MTVLLIEQFCKQNPPSSWTQREASVSLLVLLLLMLAKGVVVLLLLMSVPLREGSAEDAPHSVVKAESGMPFFVCTVMRIRILCQGWGSSGSKHESKGRKTYHPRENAEGKADGRQEEGVEARGQGVCVCL
jgi:hypothetical protein